MQVAEWYEAEGDYAAAEPLYAIVVEQARAGSPFEALSFTNRGHDATTGSASTSTILLCV